MILAYRARSSYLPIPKAPYGYLRLHTAEAYVTCLVALIIRPKNNKPLTFWGLAKYSWSHIQALKYQLQPKEASPSFSILDAACTQILHIICKNKK